MSFEGPIRPKKEKQEDPAPDLARVFEELKARNQKDPAVPGELAPEDSEELRATLRAIREKQ